MAATGERTRLYGAGGVPGRPVASDCAFSPRWATKVSKFGPLVSCGPLRRLKPLCIGQAGPYQVDDPAQVRVGRRLQAVGLGQAPADLVLGWSQGRHHPQGAVHAQLAGAVITAPGLRRRAHAGGEPRAVPFHRHGVAAEGGTERPVTLGDDGIPRKR